MRAQPASSSPSFRKQRSLEYFFRHRYGGKEHSRFSSRTKIFPPIFNGAASFSFFQLPDRDSYLSFRVCTCHGRVLSRLPHRISLEMYRSSLFIHSRVSKFAGIVKYSNIGILCYVHFSYSLDSANLSKILVSKIMSKALFEKSFMRGSRRSKYKNSATGLLNSVKFALKNIRIAVKACLTPELPK